MIRAYRIALRPSRSERAAFAQHAGAARRAGNWGLARRQETDEARQTRLGVGFAAWRGAAVRPGSLPGAGAGHTERNGPGAHGGARIAAEPAGPVAPGLRKEQAGA
jgi:hypothetical protein